MRRRDQLTGGSGSAADPSVRPASHEWLAKNNKIRLSIKVTQRSLHRQIQSQSEAKRQIPFLSTDHEIAHGRDITRTLRAKKAPEHIREAWLGTSWIVVVVTTGTRDGKSFNTKHLFFTSLRTTPEAMLILVSDRWSIQGWHWIRDDHLRRSSLPRHWRRRYGRLRTAALEEESAGSHSCCDWRGFNRSVPAHRA